MVSHMPLYTAPYTSLFGVHLENIKMTLESIALEIMLSRVWISA